MKFVKTVSVFLILQLMHTACLGQNFDQRLLQRINGQNTRYDKFWKGMSATVTPFSVATPVIMFGYGHYYKQSETRKKAIIQAEALALNTILTFGLKWSINRERPYVNDPLIYKKTKTGPHSFPSGHTSLAFATATSLTLAYPKWYVAVPAYTWAGAVGYSRMHLGVHYPSDVLIGALVGTLSSFAIHKINQRMAR
jgi:membrane-associated phospholipid phosphatase